ncbi:FUSC family membrane protein [Parafilimonas sp.]|uniref:FUSC family protein n=1 Tax=Parafilimonas sp. TaxID=1969739 RepID=UPI003F815CCD
MKGANVRNFNLSNQTLVSAIFNTPRFGYFIKFANCMDYQLTFKKIFSSQYLFTGLRITAAAIIPALILYQYDMLGLLSAIPLGALVVGSTDSPGPFAHRRNTILASICLNFLVVVVAISLHHNPVLITIFIILFGLFFSLIGVYGNRANSVGLIALLVFIFNIDSRSSFGSPWLNGLMFTAGGMCYFLMSLLLHRLRPYRYIQIQLGESLRSIAEYVETLAGLFKVTRNDEYLYNKLSLKQITIQQEQDSLREMLLNTREMVIDSTAKGRILMMMFLDSADLFEHLISLHQDYSDIHTAFDNTEILQEIETSLHAFGQELNSIGYGIQFNEQSKSYTDINAQLKKLSDVFALQRKKGLNKNTLPLFIKLRQIRFTVQDVGERIKRLHYFSGYETIATRLYKDYPGAELKVKHTEISPSLLIGNISLKSSQFRHALRVTIAMLIGYFVSLFFPLGHGYWILLTIATILKPAYSISRTRNKQRLLGTITGVIISFAFIYFVNNNTLAFLLLLCTMVIAYSLLKLNYYISCTCITIYVIISFHFLNQSDFNVVVTDRLIDTAIGCVIAFIASFMIFPLWEHEQTKDLIKHFVDANKKYFNVAAGLLKTPEMLKTDYTPVRKEAFVALANLSDNFQRMLSEKRRDVKLSFYHQFIASGYILTAHIAALSSLITRFGKDMKADDFDTLISNINEKFKRTSCILNGEPVKTTVSNRNAPITNKVQKLLQQRQQEIDEGLYDVQSDVRISLRNLKSVTDEFEMIDSIVADEVKIATRIMQ